PEPVMNVFPLTSIKGLIEVRLKMYKAADATDTQAIIGTFDPTNPAFTNPEDQKQIISNKFNELLKAQKNLELAQTGKDTELIAAFEDEYATVLAEYKALIS